MLGPMEPLTPEQLRVVACLVEKQFTTPDSYPLTENAVVAACNQLSNRNPVVAYDNNTVRFTLTGLRQLGLARVVHTPGARVPTHPQLLGGPIDPAAYSHSEVLSPADPDPTYGSPAACAPAPAASIEAPWREEARPVAAAGPAGPGPAAGASASADRVAALEERLAAV